MIEVARRYRFNATHHVPGLPEPWCTPHSHTYTVEVVFSADEILDVVVDTDVIDAAWATVGSGLEGTDLNETTGTRTTVEALATYFASRLREAAGEDGESLSRVVVWEDDDRWGAWS